jgi:choice-of-anchor B domain-containing protein
MKTFVMTWPVRVVAYGAIVAIATVALGRSGASAPAPLTETSLRALFGAAVLVGDGEIFAGEPANSFRPGVVHIYRKTGTTWRQATLISAATPVVGDQFGASFAIDGTTLLVGTGTGESIHVLNRTGTAWRHASTIVPSSVGDESARFGLAMVAADDWLFVGKAPVSSARGPAPSDARSRTGAVYLFRRTTSGEYKFQRELTPPPNLPAPGESFGSSIAISGSTALIGANGYANGTGIVYEFVFDSIAGWESRRTIGTIGLRSGDRFGTSIAITGDRAIISAPGDAGGMGGAYAFQRTRVGERGSGAKSDSATAGAGRSGGSSGAPTTSTWVEVSRLGAPAGTRADGFASAIAFDPRETWVGAPGSAGRGGIFIFRSDSAGYRPDGVRFLVPTPPTPGARVGASISLRGAIAAVGAPGLNRNGGGLLIYERDSAGVWRPRPLITVPVDEIAPVTGEERRCSEDGRAAVFDCANTDLQSFLPPSKLTHDAHYVALNDIWGWTDSATAKEWAIVGRQDGTTFVDITNPLRPIPTADLPLTEGASASTWRDIKVYNDHAYIVSDGAGQHGMQVFDLTRLRTVKPLRGQPVSVKPDTVYTEVASARNIAINEESGYAYVVGSGGEGRTCGGGLHMIDIRDPEKPTFAGCFADTTTGRRRTGYTQDVQCVMYNGSDARYHDREICIGSNETALSIADVTDKGNPKSLARATYPNAVSAHQGWFADSERYFYMTDDSDEGPAVPKTRTLIWDLANLENPRLAKEHLGVESSSDHNLYIKGPLMYQANYRSGLRVLDIGDPENPREIGFFDTAPYGTNGPGRTGAWGVYPWFMSGSIAVSSTEQGLFVLKLRQAAP